jgi:F0F1-type ATP synthase membrane subunit a
MLFVLLALKRRPDGEEPIISSFAKWNWVSLLSFSILIAVVLVFLMQFCFKAKTKVITKTSGLQHLGESILDEAE